MTHLLQKFLCLTLVVAMTLATAHAMPIAAGGDGQPMEICGDAGIETVWIDASGTPVPAPSGHDCRGCPDCLAADPVTGGLQQTALLLPPAAGRDRAARPRRLTLPQRTRLRPASRAPPACSPACAGPGAAPLPPVARVPAPLETAQAPRGPIAQATGCPAKDARA
jgi:hypothetical protein